MPKEITAIADAAFAEDYSLAVVTFNVDGGKETFEFKPRALADVVSMLSQIVMFIQSKTLSIGDHFGVPAVEAVDATATPVANKNRLVLSVKTSNGTLYEFGLEPKIAARLREEIQGAEKKLADRPSHSAH